MDLAVTIQTVCPSVAVRTTVSYQSHCAQRLMLEPTSRCRQDMRGLRTRPSVDDDPQTIHRLGLDKSLIYRSKLRCLLAVKLHQAGVFDNAISC